RVVGTRQGCTVDSVFSCPAASTRAESDGIWDVGYGCVWFQGHRYCLSSDRCDYLPGLLTAGHFWPTSPAYGAAFTVGSDLLQWQSGIVAAGSPEHRIDLRVVVADVALAPGGGTRHGSRSDDAAGVPADKTTSVCGSSPLRCRARTLSK